MQKGGTLVTFAQAGDLPSSASGCRCATSSAACHRRSSGRQDPRSGCGSTTQPLAYGMPAEGLALFMAGSQVYEVTSPTQPGRRDPRDLHRTRHSAERMAPRRAGDCEEGRGGVGETRPGKGRADRVQAAASRPDARHLQDGLQRAAERSVGSRSDDHHGRPAAIACRVKPAGSSDYETVKGEPGAVTRRVTAAELSPADLEILHDRRQRNLPNSAHHGVPDVADRPFAVDEVDDLVGDFDVSCEFSQQWRGCSAVSNG